MQRATQAEFSKDLAELTHRLGAALEGEAGAMTEALYRRCQKARQDHLKRSQLEERLQEESDGMERAQRRIEHCRERLRALCSQARCTEVSELPALEERALRKQALGKKIEDTEEQLAMHNGLSFHALLEEAEREDRDALPGQIIVLDRAIEGLEGRQLELTRESERLAGELKLMDGGVRAAAVFQQGQETLARIREGVEEYVRLKLSAALLRQAIEIYRERNQGPTLKRAGAIFSTLTCGSFTRLDTDFDEDDSRVLVGVRNNDRAERVKVESMSIGTVDQLYLALRLAAIERYLDTSEPVPLIVDDLLIQFDDRRALATINILTELSKKTQILLFTHHRHLLDLAQAHVMSDTLGIRELEAHDLTGLNTDDIHSSR
jgi:uncharacterized protein YhaN